LLVINLPDPKTGMRELFPRYFFLVTHWREEQRGGWELLEHYRYRGTLEDRLGEFNGAIGSGLSAGSFAANEASLLLKLVAFNLAGMLRGELEDASGCGWDLKRVQQTVLKAGARVVEHSRRLIVDVALALALALAPARSRHHWHPTDSAYCQLASRTENDIRRGRHQIPSQENPAARPPATRARPWRCASPPPAPRR